MCIKRDLECKPGLVCGSDNCQIYHPTAEKSSDCCMKPTTESKNQY